MLMRVASERQTIIHSPSGRGTSLSNHPEARHGHWVITTLSEKWAIREGRKALRFTTWHSRGQGSLKSTHSHKRCAFTDAHLARFKSPPTWPSFFFCTINTRDRLYALLSLSILLRRHKILSWPYTTIYTYPREAFQDRSRRHEWKQRSVQRW